MSALTRAMTEDELLQAITEAAKVYGWMVAHFRPALTGKGWRTPMQGDPGFPDLVLAKAGRLPLFLELKREGRNLTQSQRAWEAALGPAHNLVRPSDLDIVLKVLA